MTSATRTREDLAAVLAHGASTRRLTAARLRWLAGLLVVGGIIAAVTLGVRSPAGRPAYLTEAVKRGNLSVTVSATGNLQPTNTVQVGSELSGLVEAVFVDENDPVRKGQVLARLDTAKLRDQITRSEASLAAAEARLAQAEATLKESAATLERLREVSRLSGGKVPSKTEMEAAEASHARADADRANAVASVAEVRATLNTDQTNLAKASIRSPIDGIVLSRSVEPGQAVAASLQVATLFTIAQDLRQMELEVHVDEADVGRVDEGQTATFTVDAYPDRKYAAKVKRVAYGSTKTGDVISYAAVLQVSNDDLSLRPGMTASATIASATIENALLVPNAALRYTPADTAASNAGRGIVGSLVPGPPRRQPSQAQQAEPADGSRQVWVLRDGAALPVHVTTGATDGRFTQIVTGDLRESDKVITATTGGQS